jgi:predicted nucleotidyltransferase
MPVRSLRSSVLKWPDRESVDQAVRRWAAAVVHDRDDVLAIAYLGSYARGDWGVGSDLDLLVLIERSELPFYRRALEFDTRALPVPTDVFVYTAEEWRAMQREGRRFCRTVEDEAVWVYRQDDQRGGGM